jgi:preprotein translocase subunit SecG
MIKVIYVLLTILMFIDCLLLVLVVLSQLPKKEAGAGMAFGAGATDALFGAGSGNVLTKITKYLAGIFFGLAIIMALLASHRGPSDASDFAQSMLQGGHAAPVSSAPGSSTPAPSSGGTTPAPAPAGGGLLQLSNMAPPPASNAATNAPAGTNH